MGSYPHNGYPSALSATGQNFCLGFPSQARSAAQNMTERDLRVVPMSTNPLHKRAVLLSPKSSPLLTGALVSVALAIGLGAAAAYFLIKYFLA